MKTKEELNVLRNEVEMLGRKLTELTDEEMRFVTGGSSHEIIDVLIHGLMRTSDGTHLGSVM